MENTQGISNDTIITGGEQLVSESDYVQLSRLVIEAVRKVDSGQADTYHELFTEDGELIIPATIDNGKVVVPETILRGRKAIYEWGRSLIEAHAFGTIRHVCGNMRFVAIGPNEAEGITVLTVYMNPGTGVGTTLPWNVGEDHDRFVRTEQGWRLASRRRVALFARPEPSQRSNQ